MVTSVTETVMKGSTCNFCQNLATYVFSWQVLVQTHNIKLHKNQSSGSQIASCTHTDRWTHRQNMMQLAADFAI
jgi:glutaredoxin